MKSFEINEKIRKNEEGMLTKLLELLRTLEYQTWFLNIA